VRGGEVERKKKDRESNTKGKHISKYWRDTNVMTFIVSSLAKKTEVPMSASKIYTNKRSKED